MNDETQSPKPETANRLTDRTIGLLFSCTPDRALAAKFVDDQGARVLAPAPNEVDLTTWEGVELVIADEPCARRWHGDLLALKARSEKHFLPVLVALSSGSEAEPWLEAGFDDVLHMPLTRAELAARLAVFLRLRAQSIELARRSEAMYQALVEQSLVGVYLFDESGFFYVNEALAHIFGYQVDEIIGRLHPLDLTHPEDRARVTENVRERLHGEREEHRYVFRGVCKDGRNIWCEVFGRRIEYQERPAILGSLIDITQRVETHEALQLYTRRLALLRDIDKAILAAESPQEIARAALRRIRELVPCQRASVILLDEHDVEATILAVHVDGQTALGEGKRIQLSSISLVQRLYHGEPIVVDDVTTLSDPTVTNTILLKEGICSYLGLPLQVEKQLLGTLNLGASAPRAFKPEHIEVAQQVADQLAIAIRQAQLNEQVRRHADELEDRVRARTEELQRLVNLMGGREVRMAELKEVIKKLRAQLQEAGLKPVADDPLLGGIEL